MENINRNRVKKMLKKNGLNDEMSTKTEEYDVK